MPITIAITYDSLLGAEARTTDPLAGALLAHASFRKVFDDEDEAPLPEHMRGLHSLPYTTSSHDLCRAVSHAAEMLRAARFHVDLDPDLYVGPTTTFTDPQGIKFVGAAVLDAVDLVAAADDIVSTSRAIDQILDRNDGALVRLVEFFKVAADKARVAGESLPPALSTDLDAAAALTEQLCERLAETAVEIRLSAEPPAVQRQQQRSTVGVDTARSQAAARARAAGSSSVQSQPRPGAANHRIAAPLTRPDVTPPKRR
ncbi:hypothetical protein LO772_29615 [Yinghuangia sp. ASG 101]|uniref:hypothetical protein n=1 Tax=Yinghuangia sp. ASG 101 TaxID=2896848 RepID=UPI001E58608B|nr:hypothetical protein [Yinghuangia sp. ASG 101]UGQ10930.1 hypothetical protein LO772_29615 [Yinghuangia sp. ASG 101]